MPSGRDHILVVEDELDLRDMMAELLESLGYAAKTASDGADALRQLREGKLPRLILLDLMMPGMDGWAFCREKDKDPMLRAVPIVVTSAISRQDRRNAPLQAAEYLTKPLNMAKLLEVLKRLC